MTGERKISSYPVAVQTNLFPKEDGLLVVPFSQYGDTEITCIEIGKFLIPWHELADLIERMERIEKSKLDIDSGNAEF